LAIEWWETITKSATSSLFGMVRPGSARNALLDPWILKTSFRELVANVGGVHLESSTKFVERFFVFFQSSAEEFSCEKLRVTFPFVVNS
jgi:hypothetical protein